MMKLVGKETVNYTSRKTNKPVTGLKLHCSFTKPDTIGYAVQSYFIGSSSNVYEQAMNLSLETDITVGFNEFGSVGFIIDNGVVK